MNAGYRRFLPKGGPARWKALVFVCAQWLSVPLWGGLTMETVHQVYGPPQEIIHDVPGRPWVEVQHRYEEADWWISCNFVGQYCLWVDFGFKGGSIEPERMFQELERLLPGRQWSALDQRGKLRRWLNEQEDRVTLRAGGFTLHLNEYIRNVLSRRAQWQF
jgi:hypothetical protein